MKIQSENNLQEIYLLRYDRHMSSEKKEKILVIRFSSFGDIVQAMSTLGPIKDKFTHCEIHWVARSDMASILTLSPLVSKVWSFDRKSGFKGLLKLASDLKSEGYTHIYDAHSNIRSRILSLLIAPFPFSKNFIRRKKDRLKRILLFTFRINLFPKPFRGMISYLEPLKKWGIHVDKEINYHQNWNFGDLVEQKIEKLSFNDSELVQDVFGECLGEFGAIFGAGWYI